MHPSDILFRLGAIGVTALACQWLAWRLRLPAILFLLLAGVAAGPLLGWLDPDALLGPLLFPLVSLAVAVILFEGSLTLRLSELPDIGRVVRRLISLGLVVNGLVITLAARWLLGLAWDLALLLGCLTLVTGPTVIVPMLRVVRPRSTIANVLRWEGILIDPLGALLAVVVYSFIISRGSGEAWSQGLGTFGAVVLCGGLLGAAGGWLLGQLLRHHALPEYLHSLAALTGVLVVFIGADLLVHESGLLAVTLMGMWLANTRGLDLRDILHFKEELSLILISVLFILLAARLELQALLALGPAALALLAAVQLLARPLSVAVSTAGSRFDWRERLLLAWIAPRGIVAAAVSAVFAVRLGEAGHAQADLLVPLTFAVILGTVILQSATARPLARLLGVTEPAPRGFLILGANPVACSLGSALQQMGAKVLLTDSNWNCIHQARMANLPTYYGNPNSQHADIHLDRAGIGRLLALSPSDELNTLTAMRFRHEFGAQNLFSLASDRTTRRGDKHLASAERSGLPLGHPPLTYQQISERLAQGATLNSTLLTDSFGWDDYRRRHGARASLLCLQDTHGRIQVVSEPHPLQPGPGCTLLALIDPEPGPGSAKGSDAANPRAALQRLDSAADDAHRHQK